MLIERERVKNWPIQWDFSQLTRFHTVDQTMKWWHKIWSTKIEIEIYFSIILWRVLLDISPEKMNHVAFILFEI